MSQQLSSDRVLLTVFVTRCWPTDYSLLIEVRKLPEASVNMSCDATDQIEYRKTIVTVKDLSEAW